MERAVIAGACASAVHSTLMWVKGRSGVLPEFHPYEDLQHTIAVVTGTLVPASLVWILSFINGALILGFIFSRVYGVLPGRGALAKGVMFGLFAWGLMGSALFPLIGEGPFAFGVGRGLLPALLSLVMVIVYGITLSAVYSGLTRRASSMTPRATDGRATKTNALGP